ncbi:MAG: hypothetical protein EBZ43_10940, partial [Betaproteobacteria bacterium]|nr:hypothetical protein [Betaproteobacteria bacterium]
MIDEPYLAAQNAYAIFQSFLMQSSTDSKPSKKDFTKAELSHFEMISSSLDKIIKALFLKYK